MAAPHDTSQSSAPTRLGVAGRLAHAFQDNALTPLLAIVAMLLGLFAVMVTPREEEPQINVTMANVLIPFPGASAANVQNLVARPAEQVLGQIAGIEHTYSVSRPGMAILTVQFKVGVPRTEALVRLCEGLQSTTACAEPDDPGCGEDLSPIPQYMVQLAALPAQVDACEDVAGFREGGVYLITGGLGAIGRIVARHLCATYRTHVYLTGRSAPTAAQQETMAALCADGGSVSYLVCDPADLCDGKRSSCPAAFAPYGTACGSSQTCNGTGRCL